jgi:hypothetical protein
MTTNKKTPEETLKEAFVERFENNLPDYTILVGAGNLEKYNEFWKEEFEREMGLTKNHFDKLKKEMENKIMANLEKANDLSKYLKYKGSKEVKNFDGIINCGQRYQREQEENN